MEVDLTQPRRTRTGDSAILTVERAGRRSASIGDQVFRTLRSAIVTMRLRPGEALSEQDIARRLSVSRQPVREAFIKLSEDGLLRVLPQRGTFVMKISAEAVTNARFVREAVECAIAREAAQRISPGGLATLKALIAEQRKAEKADDAEAFFVLDEEFHRGLASASGCAYAWKVIEQAKAQMDRVRFLSLPEATPMRRLVAQHKAILNGVAAGNSTAAASAMQGHLREILSSLPRLATRYPAMFDAESGSTDRTAT
jgi:GntR family transcriptional regulator, rspAB operon transcriptional repressor